MRVIIHDALIHDDHCRTAGDTEHPGGVMYAVRSLLVYDRRI